MEITQLILNGIMSGTILAVPAIGLTVIFAVLRFTNFALASHMTIGAFAGYVANALLGLQVIPALVSAFLFAGLVGWLSDEFVLKPLRASGFITTAIGSIALTIGLENIVRFIFGNQMRGYDLPIRRDWRGAGLHVSPQQVESLLIALVVMGLLFAFLSMTRIGKAMRAVADNPMLAAIKGINADVIARLVSFVGMGLAGLGGMLIGLDTTIDPLVGFKMVLSVFSMALFSIECRSCLVAALKADRPPSFSPAPVMHCSWTSLP
jgi:branched-chain amino acid transport system permease protein